MFKKILVAYDGSEGAKKALEAGIKLAQLHQAELLVLAVQEEMPRTHIDTAFAETAFRQHLEQILAEAQTRSQEAGVQAKTDMRLGHPAKTIVAVAEEGKFDLILVGHSGLSGVWGRFLGSTAEKLSRHAPCSVLMVR
jgi:nucleotide-binding universal stress UspA family protein